jgi:hypothetical protein
MMWVAIANPGAEAVRMWRPAVSRGTENAAIRRKCVGEPQFDESLAAHTDSLGLTIDCIKQIEGKVNIHALPFTTRTVGLREIEMRREASPASCNSSRRAAINALVGEVSRFFLWARMADRR